MMSSGNTVYSYLTPRQATLHIWMLVLFVNGEARNRSSVNSSQSYCVCVPFIDLCLENTLVIAPMKLKIHMTFKRMTCLHSKNKKISLLQVAIEYNQKVKIKILSS